MRKKPAIIRYVKGNERVPHQKRKVAIMVNANKITRANILEAILAQDWESLETEPMQEVARKMLATIEKQKNAPKKPSKAAQENARLAHEVAMIMPEDGTAVTSIWVMEHVNGIMKPQKVSSVMKVLINKGRIEKVPCVDGKHVGYKLI